MNATAFQRALVPFAVMLSVAGAGIAQADPASFKVELTGAQSTPPVDFERHGNSSADIRPGDPGGDLEYHL